MNFRSQRTRAPKLGLRIRIPPVHWYLSHVSVVCCQVDIFATGRSLIQRSCTKNGVSNCDPRTWRWMSSNTKVVMPRRKTIMHYVYVNIGPIWSVDSVVLTVRIIQTWQPRYRVSNNCRSKRFLSYPKHPEHVCRPYYFHEGKAADTWS